MERKHELRELVPRIIKEIRKRTGLSQRRLGKLIGVGWLAVHRWEKGRTSPSPLAMRAIHRILVEMGDDGEDLCDELFPKP